VNSDSDISPFKLGVLEGPKRQHYLSKFYCDGFARGDGVPLAVYDRRARQYRPQTPVNTAVEAHFYTFLDGEGRRRFDIEDMLSKIEGVAAPAIGALRRHEKIPDEQRDGLALFVGFSCTRTPEFMAMAHKVMGDAYLKKVTGELQTEEQVAARLLAIADEVPEAKEVSPKDMLEHIHGGKLRLEVEIDRQMVLAKALKLAPRVALMMYFMTWVVLHPASDDASFATCDSPVFVPSYPSDALLAFPLCQSAYLIALPGPPVVEHIEIGKDRVRELNRACLSNTYRFCMARDQALLRNLVTATGIDNREWIPRHERQTRGGPETPGRG